jgi:hypothetical protein
MPVKNPDLTGKIFGGLTVLGIDPESGKRKKYICKCKCGEVVSRSIFPLTSGECISCLKCSVNRRKKVSDKVLVESYKRLGNIWDVAKEIDMCGQSVQERLIKLDISRKNPRFSDDDKFFLIEHYNNYLMAGKLQELADKMGRTKAFICRKAKALGFTDINRKKSSIEGFSPSIKKGHWDTREHPKGMKGKHHSQETKDRLHITSTASQARISADEDKRMDIIRRTLATRFKKGSLVTNNREKATWKAGWREIGGKRKYFRSRWEANYARYLEFLKMQGQIKEWEHEPDVFWFEGIKRGCVSFLPDFRITEISGVNVYHEVKGWMDDRSKTKIRRMAIYHPNVSLTIIDAKWFKSNNRNLTSIIYGWET